MASNYQVCQLHVKVLLLGFSASVYSFFKCVEKPQYDDSVIYSNSSFPFSTGTTRLSNPGNSRTVINSDFAITDISSIGANSKICSPIIKCIAIYMVNILTFRRTHNPPMKFRKFVIFQSFLKVGPTSFKHNTPLAAKFLKSCKIRIFDLCGVLAISLAHYGDSFHNLSLSNGRQNTRGFNELP
jgi:hypothetical protein